MRRSVRSTTPPPPPSSSQPHHRQINVVLLNGATYTIAVEGKAKVKDLFVQVCEHLNLRETEYFGLAQKVDDDFQFLDEGTKVKNLFPRTWKILSKEEDNVTLTFYFRVQFYVDHVSLLKERVTRHLYYQQLKVNLLNYNQLVTEEKCFMLAQYALHADFGNYNPQKHEQNYFDPREYFPAWVVSKHGTTYMSRHMPSLHQTLSGMTKGEAQLHFIRDVSAPPTAHNLHFYRLKKRKQDSQPTAWLGICPAGIQIYEEIDGFRSIINKIVWSEIEKLCFDKKKFEIKSTRSREGRKLQYYAFSEDWSKYLLNACQDTHIFNLGKQKALAELKHLEAEDRKYTKENYIYTNESELGHSSTSLDGSSGRGASSNRTNRTSVISNTSSNTTSGIVSDRMHTSLDDSDAASHEIIIDSPPSKSDVNPTVILSPDRTLLPLGGMSRSSSSHSGTSSSTKVASLSAASSGGQPDGLPHPPPPPLQQQQQPAYPTPAAAHWETYSISPAQTVNSVPVMASASVSSGGSGGGGVGFNNGGEGGGENNHRRLSISTSEAAAAVKKAAAEIEHKQKLVAQREAELRRQLQQLALKQPKPTIPANPPPPPPPPPPPQHIDEQQYVEEEAARLEQKRTETEYQKQLVDQQIEQLRQKHLAAQQQQQQQLELQRQMEEAKIAQQQEQYKAAQRDQYLSQLAQHRQEQYQEVQQQEQYHEHQEQYHDAHQQEQYHDAHQQEQYHEQPEQYHDPMHNQEQYHNMHNQEQYHDPMHNQEQYHEQQEFDPMPMVHPDLEAHFVRQEQNNAQMAQHEEELMQQRLALVQRRMEEVDAELVKRQTQQQIQKELQEIEIKRQKLTLQLQQAQTNVTLAAIPQQSMPQASIPQPVHAQRVVTASRAPQVHTVRSQPAGPQPSNPVVFSPPQYDPPTENHNYVNGCNLLPVPELFSNNNNNYNNPTTAQTDIKPKEPIYVNMNQFAGTRYNVPEIAYNGNNSLPELSYSGVQAFADQGSTGIYINQPANSSSTSSSPASSAMYLHMTASPGSARHMQQQQHQQQQQQQLPVQNFVQPSPLNSKLSMSLGQISQVGKHRPDCPKHALAKSDFLREVSNISTDKKLPFLNALVNDKDLINTCTCGHDGGGGGGDRLAVASPGFDIDGSIGGRPLSWCSGQLTGTMRVLDDAPQGYAGLGIGAGATDTRGRHRSRTVAGMEGIGRFLPPELLQLPPQPPQQQQHHHHLHPPHPHLQQPQHTPL